MHVPYYSVQVSTCCSTSTVHILISQYKLHTHTHTHTHSSSSRQWLFYESLGRPASSHRPWHWLWGPRSGHLHPSPQCLDPSIQPLQRLPLFAKHQRHHIHGKLSLSHQCRWKSYGISRCVRDGTLRSSLQRSSDAHQSSSPSLYV